MEANGDLTSQTEETIVWPRRRHAWRLWIPIILFTAAEILSLLQGLRLVPYSSGLFAGAMITGQSSGWKIEEWLMALSGRWTVSDAEPLGPMNRALAFGLAYMLPPTLASTAMVLGWWSAALSAAMFTALTVRIMIIWSHRRFAD